MLTAIQDFVRDSFGSPFAEELETMQVGECNVWVQHGPRALLACVIRGLPPRQLRTVFQSALERIHREMGLELENFQGDAGAFQVCAPHLRACLLGQLGGQQAKRPLFYAWVTISLPVLAAAGWFSWSLRENRRWSGYLESLKGQPGIVVTSAGSQGRRYLVSGLRDPLAPDPAQMLERFSIPASRVAFRWEPYHSFHLPFLAVREFQRYRESVERHLVLFESASSEVAPQATLHLAADVQGLLDWAARAGSQVRVEIVGHTDPRGSEALNATLSQQRAEQVFVRLVEQGIPRESLLARGVGISEPLGGQNGQQHWRERRVSFRLSAQR
jgi:outer membrane protein OmpA-like peptidoglycan-associated protein